MEKLYARVPFKAANSLYIVELWSLICRLRSKDPTQRIPADRPTWLGRRGGWKGGGKPPSQGLQGAEPPGPNLFVRAF